MGKKIQNACVIGSGPNGLSAAIVLAQAGLQVDVFEAEPIPGGGARTMELTLPGFLHDFGSAVHPLAAGSPFFTSLPLQDHGLQWIHSPAALAHPLDDGTAVVLERDLAKTSNSLGADSGEWIHLVKPFVERWQDFACDILRPPPLIPRNPLLMARFGIHALSSAKAVASRFRSERTRAFFAGLAGHAMLAFDEPLSGVMGLMFAISLHAVGWPIPHGGSQSITNSLSQYLSTLGGALKTSSRIESLQAFPGYDLYLCDVTPRQLLNIAGRRFTATFARLLQRFRYGPGVFKVDYALSEPIPWKARECLQSATVHVGGTFEQIAASERTTRDGQIAEHPFVLLAQPSLFDPTRAPTGKHTAWAYCHVPNGSQVDMLGRVEAQIERFAPGFRECVVARRASSPGDLENMNANLVGGDIGGGAMDLNQFLFRPTWRHYGTSARDVYICSSSTPPGAGVHGMCGYHAARTALKRFHRL
jgi:phytoene dehydrogenase-like protein